MRGSKAKAIRRQVAALGYENTETQYDEIKRPEKIRPAYNELGFERYNPIQRVMKSECFRAVVQAFKRELRYQRAA